MAQHKSGKVHDLYRTNFSGHISLKLEVHSMDMALCSH